MSCILKDGKVSVRKPMSWHAPTSPNNYLGFSAQLLLLDFLLSNKKSKWVICIYFLVKANLKYFYFNLRLLHEFFLGNTRGIIKLEGYKCSKEDDLRCKALWGPSGQHTCNPKSTELKGSQFINLNQAFAFWWSIVKWCRVSLSLLTIWA